MRAYFLSISKFLQFFSFIGKHAESIEKEITSEIRKLSYRKPSLLVFDDVDFMEASNEEEHRRIDIEKIFQSELSSPLCKAFATDEKSKMKKLCNVEQPARVSLKKQDEF